MWLRFEMPRPRGSAPVTTGGSVGSAIIARTNAVQTIGDAPGTVQPATSVRKAVGADSVRRRLSSIFQRPIMGIARDR